MTLKTIKTLEFDKILTQLEKYCSTYLGRAICANTKISTDVDEIQKRLEEVNQTESLILRFNPFPITEINNVTNSLKKSEIGGILSFEELLNIAHILKISRELKEYVTKNELDGVEEYILVLKYFENVYSNNGVESLILTNIIDNETIIDSASKELFSIRKNIRINEDKIRDTLNKYITSSSYSKYLQDNIITIKNDRFVIPIKQEYKSNINGLVHDSSSSGSTLFIEPTNVIELNNKLKELHIEEEKEIEKILYEYSGEIANISANIFESLDNIGYLDFLNAKTNYALANDMCKPEINTERYLKLIDARHPLISKDTVVPISLTIEPKFTSMLITGPNTGGKTVTLKTIGLLTMMAQYGLFIPAKSQSCIHVFDNIFTDIGDEQSIEQSLSTFSSHMKNIISIINTLKDNSLIIIDELGSGTDPNEGAALAQAILEYLNNMNCLTICTTHYSQLKTYAMSNPNILSASTEFNIKTLQPTYKLIIGIPGKSNAFAISEKLGLDKEILNNANKYITTSSFDFEELLTQMHNEKQEIEKIKRNTQSEYSKIKDSSASYEKQLQSLEKQKQKLINDAKEEAKSIVLEAKEKINDTLTEIYNSKNKNGVEIQRLKTDINNNLNKKIDSLSNKSKKTSIQKTLNISDLKLGQDVYITSLDKTGTIYAINDNTIKVQIGIIKTDIELSDIQLPDKKNTSNGTTTIKVDNSSKNMSTTLNVMGLNVDEAIMEIDKYIDTAQIAKLPIITILHGKGTGALRDGIHKYLKTNRNIKSFRVGSYYEGQEGVTIIELK